MFRRPHDRKPNQWWLVLLLAPFIGVLWVPLFNRIKPQVNLAVSVMLTWLLNLAYPAHGRDDTLDAENQEAAS